MSSSASTDTFPALPADVAEVRRAAGITIAPEAALHRALQERTDELERVRRDLTAEKAFSAAVRRRLVEARAERDAARAELERVRAECSELRQAVAAIESAYDRVVRERDEERAACREAVGAALSVGLDQDDAPLTLACRVVEVMAARDSAPTAPDVGSPISAPAAGAADPSRRRTPDEIRAWSVGLFGG